jgi:carboxypeptidase PM20D1
MNPNQSLKAVGRHLKFSKATVGTPGESPTRIEMKDGGSARSFRSARKQLVLAVGALLLVVGISLARTARYSSRGLVMAPASVVAISEGAAERLAGAVRIPTISPENPEAFDAEPFQSFHAYLAKAFPEVHSQLRRETVARHSLLYTWSGSDASLKPILLMGHLDVVPVEPGTEKSWQEDPFAGRIADGFVWGRGAIDNKSAVIGTLEAVEMLLIAGYRPERTVYLAYGHDEEAGGTAGAAEIAALLNRRGVELEMVLDEGGVIAEGILSGLSAPVAMVGIADKGFVSIELSTTGTGGHSSPPPAQSTIGVLSTAIARLEQNPMPARFESPTRQLFERIGPHLPFLQRAVFANLWLTRSLVTRKLQTSPTTNAMIRTTTATTIFNAGTKDNVLPSHARAVINFRILPGDSVASVIEHVKSVVADSRVNIRTVGRFSAEPSQVSSTESDSFRILEQTIGKTAPDAIVAPYQVVVVTDARYYSGLSTNVLRFLPVRLAVEDLHRMHGINERLKVRDYENVIRLYRQLILDAAGKHSITDDQAAALTDRP